MFLIGHQDANTDAGSIPRSLLKIHHPASNEATARVDSSRVKIPGVMRSGTGEKKGQEV